MSKLNILLGFFLIAVTLVFVVQIVNFLDLSFSSIDSTKKDFACSKSDFDVNIFEGERNTAVEVSSFKANISKITLFKGEESFVQHFDPIIVKGSTRNFVVNLTGDEEYYFFINDCNSTGIKK